jgi:hypothetical protein
MPRQPIGYLSPEGQDTQDGDPKDEGVQVTHKRRRPAGVSNSAAGRITIQRGWTDEPHTNLP